MEATITVFQSCFSPLRGSPPRVTALSLSSLSPLSLQRGDVDLLHLAAALCHATFMKVIRRISTSYCQATNPARIKCRLPSSTMPAACSAWTKSPTLSSPSSASTKPPICPSSRPSCSLGEAARSSAPPSTKTTWRCRAALSDCRCLRHLRGARVTHVAGHPNWGAAALYEPFRRGPARLDGGRGCVHKCVHAGDTVLPHAERAPEGH